MKILIFFVSLSLYQNNRVLNQNSRILKKNKDQKKLLIEKYENLIENLEKKLKYDKIKDQDELKKLKKDYIKLRYEEEENKKKSVKYLARYNKFINEHENINKNFLKYILEVGYEIQKLKKEDKNKYKKKIEEYKQLTEIKKTDIQNDKNNDLGEWKKLKEEFFRFKKDETSIKNKTKKYWIKFNNFFKNKNVNSESIKTLFEYYFILSKLKYNFIIKLFLMFFIFIIY